MSKQGIYVSRLTGHDTKTCGKVSSPCRTISYGTQQLSTELYIYLDGTDTLKNPYTCEAVYTGYLGILLTKSVSFISIKSRAHISCLNGKHWLVNGTAHKHGIRISFSGLAFLNTPIRLFDAFLAVDNTVFAKTILESLDIQVVKLPRFHLSLKNVVFKKNTACMIINSKSSKVFINITNTYFSENGDLSSNIPSILWLNSNYNLINIQLTNCSFKKNMFNEYGFFEVTNGLGTTNVLINQIKLGENLQKPGFPFGGIFYLASDRVFMSLKYGFIFKTSGTFLYVTSRLAEVNISNIEVDEFYSSANYKGSVFSLINPDSCSLSIEDSSFRNGNNHGTGGVIFMLTPNSTLTIQNCTIYNISSAQDGGAAFIVPGVESKTKNTSAFLRIINSSFSYSTSGLYGGAVYISARKVSAIIRDSLFLRCNARFSGGALYFLSEDIITISLHNSNFSENSADDGAIVQATSFRDVCNSYNVTSVIRITNVTFFKNRIHSQRVAFGVVTFRYIVECIRTKITVDLKNTKFMNNLAGQGASIDIYCTVSTLNYVTFDTCIFRKNVGNLGAIRVRGKALITYKHSIFDSNGVHDREAGKNSNLALRDSIIRIMNTTFVNNSCQTISAFLGGISNFTITNSDFVRNNNIRNTGTLSIFSDQNSRMTVLITKVLFQENMAKTGALYMDSGGAEFANCTFLNNFASPAGGIIMSSAGWEGRNSTKFVIRHSIFMQAIKKFYNNTKAVMTPPFLRFLGPIHLSVVNSTFNQITKSDGVLIVLTEAKTIKFDSTSLSFCPLGHRLQKADYTYEQRIKGYNFNKINNLISFSLSCEECDYNFYSLQRGTARGSKAGDSFQCLPCPTGADCVPAIKSKKNYWGYNVGSSPPKLAFTICPFGYCKSPPKNNTVYNACQGKRTGVMCGMCSQGYTEALWSTHCTPVKDCNDYWFWILFLALVFSMAIILVFKPPFVTYCLKQILWFRRSSRSADTQAYHDIVLDEDASFTPNEDTSQENATLSSTEQFKQDKRQFSRLVEITFYFYQIAQLLLSSSSLKEFYDSHFLKPVLGFFNFQPSFTKQGFLCPFPGLSPETKLVFKVAPVFGTLIAIFFIYRLHSFIRRIKGAIRPAIAPYLQASIKTIFLGYTTLATVSISLIRCVSVADESRWFYNGNITCYKWWQYASFTFIAIFVIPFIFVLALFSVKLYHDKIAAREFLLAIIFPLPFLLLWPLRLSCSCVVDNMEESQNVNALKEMLLAPYRQPNDVSKRGALYWQGVLIARRFILVVIFCMVTEPSTRLFCLTLACAFVFGCHLKLRPFQNSLANNLESLSLFFLIVLGLVNLFKSMFVGSEQNIKGSLTTVLKVFQWLETVMLGLFPAVLLLLLSFALISFSIRVLVVCCRSSLKFVINPCAHRWMSRGSTPFVNVCDNSEDGVEEYVVT